MIKVCSYKYTSSKDILKLNLSECKRREYPYIYEINKYKFEKNNSYNRCGGSNRNRPNNAIEKEIWKPKCSRYRY